VFAKRPFGFSRLVRLILPGAWTGSAPAKAIPIGSFSLLVGLAAALLVASRRFAARRHSAAPGSGAWVSTPLN